MLASLVLTALFETAITLPGGPPVGMDYLAHDRATARIWVPAGNTGRVDVIDIATGKVTQLTGFPTRPAERSGRPNMGPSSATVGDGVVWIGNRGDNKLCSFGALNLARRVCIQLVSMPDGLAYVAATREVWATTPRDNTITIVGFKGEKAMTPEIVRMAGAPEGFAVDEAGNRFFTNLEDKNVTVAIDIRTRRVVATWPSGCGAEGPRGLAIDEPRHLLFVACTDGAVTLDLSHDGKVVGKLKTGGGVDNIAYHVGRSLLYVASARDATLTIAWVGSSGELHSVVDVPTTKGARNPVVDADGTAYVADSQGGSLLVVGLPPSARTLAPTVPAKRIKQIAR